MAATTVLTTTISFPRAATAAPSRRLSLPSSKLSTSFLQNSFPLQQQQLSSPLVARHVARPRVLAASSAAANGPTRSRRVSSDGRIARRNGGRNLQASAYASTGEAASAAAASAAAASAAAASAAPAGSAVVGVGEDVRPVLGCPVCFQPLSLAGGSGPINMTSSSRLRLLCSSCSRSFPSTSDYLDLTLTVGVKEYKEPTMPLRAEAFKNPLFSFVYERGYRQNFVSAGFPGPDEEFRLALSWLSPPTPLPCACVVDLSCGSGLFTRRFAQTGKWGMVVGADLSGAMLQQAAEYIRADGALKAAQDRLLLVRSDVSRLPFCSGSIDAVHAGAAMHCWPSPAMAMAEINRVLRPGGRFVASTILWPAVLFGGELFKQVRKSANIETTMKFWETEELEELMELSGFTAVRSEQNNQFIMVYAQKSGVQ